MSPEMWSELYVVLGTICVFGFFFGIPCLCFTVSEWRKKKRNPDTMRPKEYARYIERKGEDPNEYL